MDEAAKNPLRSVLAPFTAVLAATAVSFLFDVAAEAPGEVRALAEFLPPLTSSPAASASDERELSVDDVERLRALGYAD